MTPEFEMHPHPADVPPVNPNTCMDIAARIASGIGIFLVVILLACFYTLAARASDDEIGPSRNTQGNNQGHPSEHQALHEQFYANWMRLDTGTSCCNLNDCYPTPMMRDANGRWWAMRKHVAQELERKVIRGENPTMPELSPVAWIMIPEHLFEHNAQAGLAGTKFPRDPRDSPDGRNHACVSGDTVFCAVIGEAQ